MNKKKLKKNEMKTNEARIKISISISIQEKWWKTLKFFS